MSEENKNEQQIMVPLDDLDKVESDDPHALDALAMELATIHLSYKVDFLLYPLFFFHPLV